MTRISISCLLFCVLALPCILFFVLMDLYSLLARLAKRFEGLAGFLLMR
jgi:hypothetical protein